MYRKIRIFGVSRVPAQPDREPGYTLQVLSRHGSAVTVSGLYAAIPHAKSFTNQKLSYKNLHC